MLQENLQSSDFSQMMGRFRFNRGLIFGVIIIGALLAFEAFNYSTTDYALRDLLGDLSFFGVHWATILSIAFCGIDFAGIARLFTPPMPTANGDRIGEPGEIWYLFGAWLLAATMNAMLTWWGVSLAILNHETLGNAVIAREMLLRIVPIFVSVLVWLIRVLIIGTFSVAGDRLFSQGERHIATLPRQSLTTITPTFSPNRALNPAKPSIGQNTALPRAASTTSAFRPAPKVSHSAEPVYSSSPEPSYHQPVMSARESNPSQVAHNFGSKNASGARR